MADDVGVRKDYYIRVYADPPYRDYIVNAETLDDAMDAAGEDFHDEWGDACITRVIAPAKQKNPERFSA